MEIEATLLPRSTFLAGQKLFCSIRFKSLVPEVGVNGDDHDAAEADGSSSLSSNSNSESGLHRSRRPGPGGVQSLAWASAQLHCECIYDAGRRGGGGAGGPRRHSLGGTSFSPSSCLEGSQMLSTPAKLLFCELSLSPGQSQTFYYSETLPAEAPPSYRGKNIKFCYHLFVGTQRVNSKVEILKVPFRVLSAAKLPGGGDLGGLRAAGAVLNGHGEPDPLLEQLSVANPFAGGGGRDANGSHRTWPDSDQDYDALPASIVSKRRLVFYDICGTSGRVAKLGLFKTSFALGEEVMALFSFARADLECVQYSACLACQEDIFDAASVEEGEEKQPLHQSQLLFGKFQDFCLGCEESSMSLQIPLHVTPTFASAVCTLSWRLQFEFVIASGPVLASQSGDAPVPALANGDGQDGMMSAEWRGLRKVRVQTFVWQLPVTIYASEPQDGAGGAPSAVGAASAASASAASQTGNKYRLRFDVK